MKDKTLGAQGATADVAAGSTAPDAAIARHTPGPWFIRTTNFISYIKAETGHKEIAVMYDDSGVNKRANAHLIAAAPELLAFAKSMARRHQPSGERQRCLACGLDGDCCGTYHAAVKAIAKAEGRS